MTGKALSDIARQASPAEVQMRMDTVSRAGSSGEAIMLAYSVGTP